MKTGLRHRVIEKLTYMSGPGVALVFSSTALVFVLVVSLGVRAVWS